ncbi:hypothetical protein D3C81_1932870 [compost metagenome]
MSMVLPFIQGSFSNSSGVIVVFPAPGSAIRTAEGDSARAFFSSGIARIIGSVFIAFSPLSI